VARGFFGPERVAWVKQHCVPVVGNTGNAVYMMTAGGKPLDNARKRPEYVGQDLNPQAALEEFNRLPEEDRKPKDLPALKIAGRRIAITPEILALRVLYRPLAADGKGRSPRFNGGFRGVNRDFVWFKEQEWRALVPADPKKGAEVALPEPLVLRLARYHLSNLTCTSVCGNHVWKPAEVLEKDVRLVVEEVTATAIRMRLTGHARMDAGKGKAEFRLGGVWTYDRAKKVFDRIEFVATGGFDNVLNPEYYTKMMGEERTVMGIAFELAEPGSFGYGTPPAPFFYDATGLNYFGGVK
jgi:hypothetical protein